MKKCVSLLLAVLLVFTGLPISAVAKTPSNAIDIGVDCLMSVFDLSKSQELVRLNTKSIIDSEKVKDSNLMYGMTSGPLTYAEYYAGEDVMSYAKEAGQDISAGISEEISAGTLFKINLSGKISESVKTAYANSTETYFNTFKVVRKVGVNKVHLGAPADYDEVRSVLNDQFKTALLAADTDSEINALFDLYGTHFIAAYSLGGWAEATTSTVNTSSSIKNELKDAFSSEAGAKASAGEYGAGLSIAFSLQNTISSTYNTSEYKTATYNKVYGGKGGLNFSDASQANTVYNNWVNTINPYDSTTTEIVVDNNLELVGIWDLLPAENTAQIAKMKQVFIDRLGQFNESFVNTFVYSNYAIDGVKKLSVDLLEDETGIDTEPNVPAGYIPISTVAQFKAIGTGSYPLNGKYILLNDLDFGNTSISPIGGTSGTSFAGTFDGNGFTLKNISTSVSGLTAVTYYHGLFGVNGGTIKNLVIDNYKVTINTPDEAPIKDGVHNIGIICGYNTGTVNNCKVLNSSAAHTVIVKNGKGNTITTILGGITGTNNGTISFASVENTYLGLANTLWTASNSSINKIILGGIAGNVNGIVSDCYTKSCTLDTYLKSGHLTEYYYGGGEGGIFGDPHCPYAYIFRGEIIGYLMGSSSNVKRCFTSANKKQGEYLLVHGAIAVAHSNYRNCHINLGQIVGYFEAAASNACSNCYYMASSEYGKYINKQVSYPQSSPSGCSFLSSLQATKEIFISNGWKMDENDIYPTFDVSQKSFSFVVACPNLFENVYPGDVLPDELKIYFVTSYPAYSVYEDITDNALIAYDFSEDKSGSIQVAYLKENTVYLGTVEVELSEIKLESVEVESLPAETEFQIGNAFSADGLVLKANYNNGSYAYVSDDLVTSFDNKVIESSGEKTVTVIYNTKETNYNISCYECKGTNTHTESAAVNENVVNATCTSGGSFEKAVYCSVCGKELRRDRLTTAALNHKWGAWTQTDAPLCLVDGEEQRVCLNDTSHIEKRKVAAIGHNYVGAVTKEPSCTEKGVMTYTCKNDASHYFTEDIDELDHTPDAAVMEDKIEATCTVDGSYNMVVYCATCGEKLSTTPYTITAPGHTPGAEATCTEDQVCTVCGEVLTPKLGHTPGATVMEDKIEATCTVDGSYNMVVYCTACGEKLSTTPYTITAPGHTPGAEATCTEDQTCTVCGEVLTPKLGHTPGATVMEDKIEATCTVDGSYNMVVYCATCGEKLSTTPYTITAPGHTPGAEATCTEDQVCTVCGEVLVGKLGHTSGAAVMEDKIEATCTVDGSYNMVVYCATCGEKLSTTPYTITAPGHTPGTEATCTEDQTCTVCGEVLIEKLGHTPGAAVMEDKIETTCTVDGSYNIVVYCATCGEKLSTTPYTITAPGHTPGAEATCTEDQVCTVCGEVLVGKLGHDYDTVVTAPTCTKDGFTTYTCSVCGDTYTADETSATGHDWGEWTVKIPATVKNEGEEIRVCATCDEEESRIIDKLELPTELVIYAPCTVAKETEDGYAVVTVGTTVDELLAASNGTDVLNSKGEKVAPETVLATGMQLVIMTDETIIDCMEIAVLGDVNGDGAITSDDARTTLRLAVGLDVLDGAFLAAAKVNPGVTVSANDARSILRASVGLDDPAAWFDKI